MPSLCFKLNEAELRIKTKQVHHAWTVTVPFTAPLSPPWLCPVTSEDQNAKNADYPTEGSRTLVMKDVSLSHLCDSSHMKQFSFYQKGQYTKSWNECAITDRSHHLQTQIRSCVCFTGHQDFRGVFWLLSELSRIQGASFVPENYPRRRHRPQLSGRGQRMFGCFTHLITDIFHTCYLTFVGFKIDGQKVDNVSELSTSLYRQV